MGEVEFDRIVDAVRKEIALAPTLHSLTGLRASDWRVKGLATSRRPSAAPHNQDSPCRRGTEAIQVKR